MMEYLLKIDFEVDSGDYKQPDFLVERKFADASGWTRLEIPKIEGEAAKCLGDKVDHFIVSVYRDTEHQDNICTQFILRMEFFRTEIIDGNDHIYSIASDVFSFPYRKVTIPKIPDELKTKWNIKEDYPNEVEITVYRKI